MTACAGAGDATAVTFMLVVTRRLKPCGDWMLLFASRGVPYAPENTLPLLMLGPCKYPYDPCT